MKWYFIVMVIFVLGCKMDQTIDSTSSLSGKYIDGIKHYKIHLKDGNSYDMNEKDTRKVYYIMRHAEKDSIPKGNPQLSEVGLERANRLADILSETSVDAIYSTMTTRTLFTVDSLADLKGLTILPYEASNFKNIYNELNQSLDIHRAVIVGHSNTVPVMANHILGKEYFDRSFEENQYDDLIIIVEDNNNQKKLLALKYK